MLNLVIGMVFVFAGIAAQGASFLTSGGYDPRQAGCRSDYYSVNDCSVAPDVVWPDVCEVDANHQTTGVLRKYLSSRSSQLTDFDFCGANECCPEPKVLKFNCPSWCQGIGAGFGFCVSTMDPDTFNCGGTNFPAINDDFERNGGYCYCSTAYPNGILRDGAFSVVFVPKIKGFSTDCTEISVRLLGKDAVTHEDKYFNPTLQGNQGGARVYISTVEGPQVTFFSDSACMNAVTMPVFGTLGQTISVYGKFPLDGIYKLKAVYPGLEPGYGIYYRDSLAASKTISFTPVPGGKANVCITGGLTMSQGGQAVVPTQNLVVNIGSDTGAVEFYTSNTCATRVPLGIYTWYARQAVMPFFVKAKRLGPAKLTVTAEDQVVTPATVNTFYGP